MSFLKKKKSKVDLSLRYSKTQESNIWKTFLLKEDLQIIHFWIFRSLKISHRLLKKLISMFPYMSNNTKGSPCKYCEEGLSWTRSLEALRRTNIFMKQSTKFWKFLKIKTKSKKSEKSKYFMNI